ncbi:gamma-glutamylcyclotransferase [Sedimentimonas flavescens]|uniref:gamma-glutamylcyclotransferase n=1 Tax=Sedimentimonas flavescens TaxID=2851012 RepID=UPI0021A55D23|nr:gamma-glutamylcyclotransferase [Sedimentimonas flavescens]MCT2541117.1 gamma-glutamylcyclotransferase [Sedimentimonas flavescens]
MADGPRVLSLTPGHVARVHREIKDGGQPAGLLPQTDQDYAEWVDRILASHPAPDRPTQLFAYGSLIWRPEIDHRGEQCARLPGWRRSFCLRQWRFRGSPEYPGLMMSLDRGGECEGVLFELPKADLEAQFHQLFRREFTVKPITNIPTWLRVETGDGPVNALVFVMNRESPQYAGDLTPGEVADVLSQSCGHLGTGAEYLLNTVTQLEARGMHDEGLWLLQELVAQRIDARS